MQELLAGEGLLGLLAAAFWGVGDFSGGMAAKTAGGSVRDALKVVLISHSSSLVLLTAFVWWRGEPFPHGAALVWGLAAGVLGGVSVAAFYVALASGAMGASAALSGLLAAAVPAVVSGFSDGLPGWQKFCGFVVAGTAIWLIASGPAVHEQRRTTILALLSGTGFGLFFVAIRFASRGSAGVVAPLLTARMASVTTCLLLLLILGLAGDGNDPAETQIDRAPLGTLLLWVVATAIFDTGGNLFFVAATRAGRLDIAAVLASLYPASTILLAGAVLKERPSQRQAVGMAIAVAAVVLITS